MHEYVIISGKGGTGKTSMTASFAYLAGQSVIVDCDVDAADLHLVLSPRIVTQHEFFSGHEARIREDLCTGCGVCHEVCRFEAVHDISKPDGTTGYRIDPIACEGCGVCVRFCPAKAIDFPEKRCGTWMISETRCGPMVHARLGVAAENSGKLVSTVRREARRLAETQHRSLILVDGPPGIGCPVIASLTGATKVLVVTEPTVSGEHDLKRVLALTRHFRIPTAICVNKWDLNPHLTDRIEAVALESGARVAGRVRYDSGVTAAQLQQRSVVETSAPSARDIVTTWHQIQEAS